jgi:hypothetical protein
MTLKVAYFQPVVLAIDDVPAVQFSQIFNLVEMLHNHPELNDADNPLISIRGGQQIQVYPNQLNVDVSWLVHFLEGLCNGYMEIVSQQSGTEDLRLCKPVVTSIWTIRQRAGDYQEMHSHPGGNLSGNIYISSPDFSADKRPSDGQIAFHLPHTRDVSKFIMNDNWKYSPAPGTVIMFPSYLNHSVYPWKGEGHRTVMAFDAKLVPREEDGQS